jgi:hypothetical protein
MPIFRILLDRSDEILKILTWLLVKRAEVLLFNFARTCPMGLRSPGLRGNGLSVNEHDSLITVCIMRESVNKTSSVAFFFSVVPTPQMVLSALSGQDILNDEMHSCLDWA